MRPTISALCAIPLAVLALNCGGDDASDETDDTYEPTGTGPAARVFCDSSGMNAFDTYGTTGFVAVNEKIFELVTAELTANGNANLGDSFSGVADFARFKGRLAVFLVFVYGGPDTITYTDGVSYTATDQDMTEAHTGMGITSAQYDFFVTNIIVPALTTSGVTADDVSSCFAPPVTDATFKASIVGK